MVTRNQTSASIVSLVHCSSGCDDDDDNEEHGRTKYKNCGIQVCVCVCVCVCERERVYMVCVCVLKINVGNSGQSLHSRSLFRNSRSNRLQTCAVFWYTTQLSTHKN